MLALKAENISKQYRLGQVGTGTLSHDLNRFWHEIRGKENPYLKIGEANDRAAKADSEYVWSLRDINFEIEQGDAVGIIGKNGAGKSTLLKLLSKVTKPTTGKIYTNGRIASLLEVGTGFHPEMTGRENIYLNGAILGMTRREIKRKFDEIVDFSGVERYIDTPVKRYSSGMYVRLAFAVAAHLESEILIVDEVLAVGDAEFQKKCLGKMGNISKGEGRTVLFVSHNMAAVKELTKKALLLSNGNLLGVGSTDDIITSYTRLNYESTTSKWEGSLIDANSTIEIKKVEIIQNSPLGFSNQKPLICRIDLRNNKPLDNSNYRLVLTLKSAEEIVILNSAFPLTRRVAGDYFLEIEIPEFTLSNTDFILGFRIDIPKNRYIHHDRDYVRFSVNVVDHTFGDIAGSEPGGFFHLPLEAVVKEEV
ncbi:ABC-type polysaccharide/polyol phosphate transport system, ATPase component [Kaistella treverensis]|uniref:ABC-type polysaccharide/polyol phosphate transport system, ATPase component n=1 Tax=Kaistella treverensis TaxID=631455 RepID=A0A1I3M9X7_9FLAO|nr:ABC transporter ATP-binding protein [Kaistella treverensis]SFI93791.1 ABC-type polysaccharide/polyol phosphate transport system, ATPase component [Kaistella treverensis]